MSSALFYETSTTMTAKPDRDTSLKSNKPEFLVNTAVYFTTLTEQRRKKL